MKKKIGLIFVIFLVLIMVTLVIVEEVIVVPETPNGIPAPTNFEIIVL
jgi:hypothetical protein